ncbi:hypothetical protein V1279_000294 [Bradyrhizobium sp. AZCC 1610]
MRRLFTTPDEFNGYIGFAEVFKHQARFATRFVPAVIVDAHPLPQSVATAL